MPCYDPDMTKRDFFHHWFNWYALLTPLWVGFILFNEFICWRDWSAQDWAAWAGALGTFLAFAGTIWLAGQETRRRERIERGHMLLSLSDMVDQIKARASSVEVVRDSIQEALDKQAWVPNFSLHADFLKRMEPWEEKNLINLLVLEGDVSYRLKQSQTCIESAVMALSFPDKTDDAQIFFRDHGVFLQLAADSLGVARDHLEFAFTRCLPLIPHHG